MTGSSNKFHRVLRVATTVSAALAATVMFASAEGGDLGGVGRRISEPLPAPVYGESEPCYRCTPESDFCSGTNPTFPGDPNYHFANHHIVAATGWVADGSAAVVTIFDLDTPPGPDLNWPAPMYQGPTGPTGRSWSRDTLGTVFGITFDESGNIYVAHTAAYGVRGDNVITNVRYDYFGKSGVPGTVYKIFASDGHVAPFAQLPNYRDSTIEPGMNSEDVYPGLGNIAYDQAHQQFFVTNIEDGRIYRLRRSDGAILSVYDPGKTDMGPIFPCPPPIPCTYCGAAPLQERLWGVAVHRDRVYFSKWGQDQGHPTGPRNLIGSVGLDAAGDFLGTLSEGADILLPVASEVSKTYSNPVSDIVFSPSGTMVVGERGMKNFTRGYPHESRVLEYQCSGGTRGSGWVITSNVFSGGAEFPYSSEGGLAYDHTLPGVNPVDGRLWAMFDALHHSTNNEIYGLEALPRTGGNHLNSFLIDLDADISNAASKTLLGDIAIQCPFFCPTCKPVELDERNHREGSALGSTNDIAPSPNPFEDETTIMFSLANDQDVMVAVFDLSGRLVRTLHHGRLRGGPHQFRWDGANGSGGRSGPGVYLIRVSGSSLSLSSKIVHVE